MVGTTTHFCHALDPGYRLRVQGVGRRSPTTQALPSRPESLALRVGLSLKGDDVVEVLNGLIKQRGAPRSIRVDNGTEFTSVVLDQWAYWNGVILDFSRPGKPQDNAFIEAFNSRFRQECLNENWFLSVADAQEKVEAWRKDYNGQRAHSALSNMTPEDFARHLSLAGSPPTLLEEVLGS